jgi:1-deoxy-D-xylulose 5-phosphate reductoisomerase
MKKQIAILGSTGSIGKSLLKIINRDKKKYKIILLTANKNYKKILEQAETYKVKNLVITDQKYFELAKIKNNRKFNIYNNFNCFEKIFKK